MKYCYYCGTQLPDEADFCVKCGKKQEAHSDGTLQGIPSVYDEQLTPQADLRESTKPIELGAMTAKFYYIGQFFDSIILFVVISLICVALGVIGIDLRLLNLIIICGIAVSIVYGILSARQRIIFYENGCSGIGLNLRKFKFFFDEIMYVTSGYYKIEVGLKCGKRVRFYVNNHNKAFCYNTLNRKIKN